MRPMICPIRHPGCLRRGTAALELAIILPVLVTIVLSCLDFGQFAYNYIALSNAVRAGAAWGMMQTPPPSDPPAWQTSIQTAVSNEMSLQPGFVPDNLTVDRAATHERTPAAPTSSRSRPPTRSRPSSATWESPTA